MDTKKEIEELNELIALDQYAAGAYESATKAVQQEPIRRYLKQYQDEHSRHVQELSQAVRSLGGTPPTGNAVKGSASQGLTVVSPSQGTEGALKALKNNAKVTNRYYAQAKGKPFSATTKAIIERCFQDVRGQLSWIEETLQARSWESGGAHP